jgi:hypothetical protein
VRAAGDHHVAVLGGALPQREQRGGDLELHELQRAGHLELLDVLGQVAAGEAEVDELPLGQLGEFLNARLHVVKRDALALLDALDIHVAAHTLVVLDGLGRDGHAEVLLRLHDGDPEIALQQDAPVGRPDRLHRGRGIALGEHVGDGFDGLGGWLHEEGTLAPPVEG